MPHELLATTEVAQARPSWVHAKPARSVVVRGLAEVEACDLSLGDPGEDSIVDPVCGLAIARSLSCGDDAEPRFCSEACLGSWRERPGSGGAEAGTTKL